MGIFQNWLTLYLKIEIRDKVKKLCFYDDLDLAGSENNSLNEWCIMINVIFCCIQKVPPSKQKSRKN